MMGYSVERVLRAPCSGRFETNLDIGDRVEAGASVGTVNGQPVISQIGGILRGLLRAGLDVEKGAKWVMWNLVTISGSTDALTRAWQSAEPCWKPSLLMR